MIEKLTDEQLEVLNQGEDEVNLTTIAGWIMSDVESLLSKIVESITTEEGFSPENSAAMSGESRSNYLAYKALLEAHSYLRDSLFHLSIYPLSMSHLNDNKNDIG